MKLLTLDTQAESNHFGQLFTSQPHLFESWTHIGGIVTQSKSKNDWYWYETGKKIDINLDFHPGEPNNSGDSEMCLSLDKRQNKYKFNDTPCSHRFFLRFVCQVNDSGKY